jgi:hypothetical protein
MSHWSNHRDIDALGGSNARMCAVRALAIGALAMACSRGSEPLPGVQPAQPAERPAIDSCKQFIQRLDALSGFLTPTAGATGMCQKYSGEQIRCGIAATNLDELGLCIQIKDPARRERARPILASIRGSWPGSTSMHEVLAGKSGCALGGVVGEADAPLDERHAIGAFVLRSESGAADPDPEARTTLVTFERSEPSAPWRCVETDQPAVGCTQFTARCKAL